MDEPGKTCPLTNPELIYGSVALSALEQDLIRHEGNWGRVSYDHVRRIVSSYPSIPQPELVAEYLRLHALGQIGAARGRPIQDTVLHEIRMILFEIDYERNLDWILRRQKSRGLAGWSAMANKDWWEGPPHERAARMVVARYRVNMSWRTLHNKLSKRRAT